MTKTTNITFALVALTVLSIGLPTAFADLTTRSGGTVTQTYHITAGTSYAYGATMCGQFFWTEATATGNKVYEEWSGPSSMNCSGTNYTWSSGTFKVQENDSDGDSNALVSETFTDVDGIPASCDGPGWTGCDNTETDNRIDANDQFDVTITWRYN